MPGRKTARKPRAPRKVADSKVALAGQRAIKQQLLRTVTTSVSKKKV